MFEDQHDEEGWGLSDAQDHEFIPLISAEDEEAMQKEEVPEALPCCPCAIPFCSLEWSFPSQLAETDPFGWSKRPTSSSTGLV